MSERGGYRRGGGRVDQIERQACHWPSDQDPSWSVIETVADVTETKPTELQPLHEVVDPEALDNLFHNDLYDSSPASRAFVRFRYEGCIVTVHADGRIVVSVLDSQ